MNKLVSIITPSFNAESWIEETYNSILNQTYKNWEWLVTDDVSTDNTLSILNRLASMDDRIKIFVNGKNSGAAVSRNCSISNANGRYLAFIDSDDLWHPEKLRTQIEFMKLNQCHFSFTSYELIDGNDKELGKIVDSHLKEPVSYDDMLRKKATLGCSTVVLDKEQFDDCCMPLIRTGQDYGLWLKLLKTGVKAYHLNEVFTKYRILPNSISRNKLRKAKRQWEIYRRIEGLTFLTSIECFFYYAWRAVFRK